MPDILRVDFETRSVIDLPKRGVHIYAADPSTDALCMAYAFNDEEVEIWIAGEELPKRIKKHIKSRGLVGAWNAAFELAIWNTIMAKRYGWPSIWASQCRCTMMMSAAMSLPLGLNQAAKALSLDISKDDPGYRLMLRMSKPRKLDPLTWWEDADRLERLYAYCKQDVEVERKMASKLRDLIPEEQKLWELDQEINNRGVPVDLHTVRYLILWCDSERDRLNKEMAKVTNHRVRDCSDLVGLKEFCDVGSVAKAALDQAIELRGGKMAEALMLRRDFAKTSTKKLDAFERGTMEDGYMRGIFQFYGAESTGRWSGRRVQPQNFPRPSCSQDEIERRISERDFTSLNDVANCLRGMIAAPEGQELICSDFSSIEARVLAWMAGQQDVIDAFVEGLDLYKVAAGGIYGAEYKDVTKDQRQIGKVAILALGYQGAKGAFKSMAAGYGVEMEDDKIDTIVRNWREANSHIVDWWYALERAAEKAIKTKRRVDIGQLIFLHKYGHLWLRLPSGRKLCWPRCKISKVSKPWGEAQGISYVGENSFTHKVERLTTYGGKIAENIVQAVARDLLAGAMVRVEAAGYDVRMHVHDEVVALLHEGGSLREFNELMAFVPEWADGLPLGAEGWVGRRYRK